MTGTAVILPNAPSRPRLSCIAWKLVLSKKENACTMTKEREEIITRLRLLNA